MIAQFFSGVLLLVIVFGPIGVVLARDEMRDRRLR